MLIDWYTVGAQTINFLILVWLMKRFLYQPILDAIDAREKRIALALEEADAIKATAQAERDEFQYKNEEFEQRRAALLSQATDEAKVEYQRLLAQARQEADALRAKRLTALKSELRNLQEDIARRNQQEVFAIARKMLTDLAGTSLEQRMSEVFVCRLRELSDEAKADLSAARKTGSDSVLVRSAFELSSKQRAAIQEALSQTFSIDIPARFDTVQEVVGGIELSVNGWKFGWSIADYLAALEKHVAELEITPSDLEFKVLTIDEKLK